MPTYPYEAHCGRKGCSCTHADGCFKGWVDMPARAHNGTTYRQTGPCPICRHELVERLAAEGEGYRGGPTPFSDQRTPWEKERDARGNAKMRAAVEQSARDQTAARAAGCKTQPEVHAYVMALRVQRGDS